MYTYLLINIAIIFIPLLLSFEKRIRFYKNFPALLISLITVGILFIYWDTLATSRGDWSFNSKYVLGFRIFNLPFEEFLFFITVPFACIFTYEVIKYFVTEKTINFYLWIFLLSGLVILFNALNGIKLYTLTVSAIFIPTLALLKFTKFLREKTFYIFTGITFIQFFIVNSILTALPVVEYSPKAINGFRVFTIPIEDFIYSFTMLSLYLIVYRCAKECLQKRKPQ